VKGLIGLEGLSFGSIRTAGGIRPLLTRKGGDHMSNLVKKINAFWQEEDGVTAIEYGLIAALIGVAIIATVTIVGTSLQGKFTEVSNAL
jgi:pilus assembly protein Flp/PilA